MSLDARIALGLPSLTGYDLFSALAKTRELGFQSVMGFPGGPNARHSLGEFPTFEFYHASHSHKEKVRNALSHFRHVSVHQAWDDNWKEWIDCAEYFGADSVTIHYELRRPQESLKEFRRDRIAHFSRIGDYAGTKGIRIGIENFGGTVSDYVALMEAIAHPYVGATLDTGHCAYFEEVCSVMDAAERVVCLNGVIREMVRSLGDRILHFHVHDVRERDWRDHRTVSTGVIDFPGLFRELSALGYPGLFDIELEEAEREEAAAKTGLCLTRLFMENSIRSE